MTVPRDLTAYLTLHSLRPGETVHRTVKVDNHLHVDLRPDGSVIGIEVVGAQAISFGDLLSVIGEMTFP